VIIGGFQRFTLSDFPGKIAVIVFLQGCNFRCPFCHNGSLLSPQPERPVPVEEIMQFLQEKRKKIGGVVLSGGEPTLQKDLERFIKPVKSMGYAVKLDTNGSRPEVIAQLITKKLLDYIAMDIKAPFEKYPVLCGTQINCSTIKKSIETITASGVPHHFRTTYVPSLLTRDDLKAIQHSLPSRSTYTVQPFKSEFSLVKNL
jgi:pyruvate formate lyase activating enzyme